VIEIDRLIRSVEEMKTSLRSFQKYVPADLVRDLLQKGIEARLGGQRAMLTISFSDIAGFTSIAETLPPEALVDQLGEYLNALSGSVHRHQGTVDKYIGDALMAFWGAPEPNPDHALDACRTALDYQRELAVLCRRWRERGQPEFHARTGVHTGDVVVGNIGSDARLNYTVIGDPVNLASRLEGLNKLYGTSILITDDTHRLVSGELLARPVDRVQVKGRAGGILIFELLGAKADQTGPLRNRVETTVKALNLYFRRDFSQAQALYRELMESDPDDALASVMAARCADYLVNPPSADWDGIYAVRTK
jgi:adenylate cyclase